MDIKIYHLECEEYLFDDSVHAFYFNEQKDNPSNFMKNIIENYKDSLKPIVILTNIYCDYAEGPCGCYAYSACEWHRNRYSFENDYFAPCLCSEKYKIVCEYHS